MKKVPRNAAKPATAARRSFKSRNGFLAFSTFQLLCNDDDDDDDGDDDNHNDDADMVFQAF